MIRDQPEPDLLQRSPLPEDAPQRLQIAQLRLQIGGLEELVDPDLHGADLVADVLQVVERRSAERALQPDRGSDLALRRPARELGIELYELDPGGVRGPRH